MRVYCKLAHDFPDRPDFRSELAAVLHNFGLERKGQGEPAAARPLLDEALRTQRAAVRAAPGQARYRELFRSHWTALTNVLIQLADHAEAARVAEELPRMFPERGLDHARAAGVLSRCVPLAQKDGSLPADKRAQVAAVYGDRGLELLRAAVRHGFREAAVLREDAALAPLRARPEFQEILRQAEKE